MQAFVFVFYGAGEEKERRIIVAESENEAIRIARHYYCKHWDDNYGYPVLIEILGKLDDCVFAMPVFI